MQKNAVFRSDITRGQKSPRNDLYNLLHVNPAMPCTSNIPKESNCNFEPKCDKYYVPKKRNKLRVKTVRDIRSTYEKDVYSYLPTDLERQQSILLKRITGGSSRKDNTKSLAQNIMKSDNPLCRSSWQMLMNLNPGNHPYSIQYILWNGKQIRVNGSKGGKNKYLFNFDLGPKIILEKRKLVNKKTTLNAKKGLLQNSLRVKFKPGPLTRKKYLDDSYQKFNVGRTELVNLPKPGLEIQPLYGVVLEPVISNFLQNMRKVDGTISEKWAQFAVSVLGTINSSVVTQNNTEENITFDLNYKSNQRRILMRRDIDNSCEIKVNANISNSQLFPNIEVDILPEVKDVLNDILNTVDISLQQDEMFTGIDEPREFSLVDSKNINVAAQLKDKRNLELDRLDVTVIRLPIILQDGAEECCPRSFCSLGCICSSLRGDHSLKQHCGRLECMFDCRCDFSKYRTKDTFENVSSGLIPGLMKLDNEINLKLAKEEQKFHQTVVVSGEKSILLKTEKRNSKASKKYADFYTNICLKSETKPKQILSVVSVKLNCNNVEPWCMIHNLYKCFCKGKFTDKCIPDKVDLIDITETVDNEMEPTNNEKDETYALRPKRNLSRSISNDNSKLRNSIDSSDVVDYVGTCARVEPYGGRKYNTSYYVKVNEKISQLERNDRSLQEKIMNIVKAHEIESDQKSGKKKHNSECKDDVSNNIDLSESEDIFSVSNELRSTLSMAAIRDIIGVPDVLLAEQSKTRLSGTDNSSAEQSAIKTTLPESYLQTSNNRDTSPASCLQTSKNRLSLWLESNYKMYKRRADKGLIKTSLDPPKLGKLALYPWEFILSRYKERKNLFLITKQRPFRIFMAVDSNNALFDNCLNINDIRFSELHQYPATIKNLLTNATNLKDNFCILCGTSFCWELVGTVTKTKEPIDSEPESQEINTSTKSSKKIDESELNPSTSNDDTVTFNNINLQEIKENFTEEISVESSKWFVMTVENDFTEIQFYKKGFFVKYESIIKAINVARMSGKTVRLSSQKCTESSSSPQFGIYAVPSTNEYCVYVGPYEKTEQLGIETVKSISHALKLNRTRGVWIYTKSVDNLKVIDNPLSFMPPNNLHPSKIVQLETESVTSVHSDNSEEPTIVESPPKEPLLQECVPKVVKPIKIRRTNGFYHFARKGLLKPVENKFQNTETIKPKGVIAQTSAQNSQIYQNKAPVASLLLRNSIYNAQSSSSKNCNEKNFIQAPMSVDNKKPIAEIAPQIKIVDVYSEAVPTLPKNTIDPKKETGMFVLKPEEINKRLLENMKVNINDQHMDDDIENFLATSAICTLSHGDNLIFDEDSNNVKSYGSNYKGVWIESTNIKNLGWIPGIKNPENYISFEFPGFKYTEFYSEEEAFRKINQVLSRKVYVPKYLVVEWRVVESKHELNSKQMLAKDNFTADLILTKLGLHHKSELAVLEEKKVDNPLKTGCPFADMEEESRSLEEEGNNLLTEFKKMKADSFMPLPNIINQSHTNISDTLQGIISSYDSDSDN